MSESESKVKTEVSGISDRTLAEVIDLAKLDPMDPSLEAQKVHLRKIIEYFKVLKGVELDEHGPTTMINPTPLRLREDEIVKCFSKDEAMNNSRLRLDEYFHAPRIHSGEEPEHV